MGVVLLAMFQVCTAPASAYVESYGQLPESQKQVWRGFQQYLAGKGQPNALTPAQQTEFTRLVNDYKLSQRAGSASKASRLWTAMRGVTMRAAQIRLPITTMGTIPVVAAGAAAFTGGYLIGTGIRQMILGFEGATTPQFGSWTSIDLQPVEEGGAPFFGPCCPSPPAPEDGYVVVTNGAKRFFTTGNHPCTGQPDPQINLSVQAESMPLGGTQNITCQPGDANYCNTAPIGCTNTHELHTEWVFVPLRELPVHFPERPYPDPEPDPSRVKAVPETALPPNFDQAVDSETEADSQIERYVVYVLDPAEAGDPAPHEDPFADDWITVPQPLPNEVGTDYADRLTELGLVPDVITLPDTSIDPDVGPNEVARTSPAPETEVPPDTTVKVYVNPDTAPVPPAGGWSPPPVSGIDLSPLNVGTPCDAFPFGIFCWMGEGLTAWNSGESCPIFTVPFAHGDLDFDLCQFEPAMEIVRPVLIILAAFSAAFMFAAAAMGFGGAAANDD